MYTTRTHAPKCGRRSRTYGYWGWCSVTRPRTQTGYLLPACMAHLTRRERESWGLTPGVAPRPRREMLDVAKLRAGDRD